MWKNEAISRKRIINCYIKKWKKSERNIRECLQCKKVKIIKCRGSCIACYDRILRASKRKITGRLDAKDSIVKAELTSDSEDNFEIPKYVSSGDEDEKPIIKQELKCEPSTS